MLRSTFNTQSGPEPALRGISWEKQDVVVQCGLEWDISSQGHLVLKGSVCQRKDLALKTKHKKMMALSSYWLV